MSSRVKGGQWTMTPTSYDPCINININHHQVGVEVGVGVGDILICRGIIITMIGRNNTHIPLIYPSHPSSTPFTLSSTHTNTPSQLPTHPPTRYFIYFSTHLPPPHPHARSRAWGVDEDNDPVRQQWEHHMLRSQVIIIIIIIVIVIVIVGWDADTHMIHDAVICTPTSPPPSPHPHLISPQRGVIAGAGMGFDYRSTSPVNLLHSSPSYLHSHHHHYQYQGDTTNNTTTNTSSTKRRQPYDSDEWEVEGMESDGWATGRAREDDEDNWWRPR